MYDTPSECQKEIAPVCEKGKERVYVTEILYCILAVHSVNFGYKTSHFFSLYTYSIYLIELRYLYVWQMWSKLLSMFYTYNVCRGMRKWVLFVWCMCVCLCVLSSFCKALPWGPTNAFYHTFYSFLARNKMRKP